MGNSIYNYMYGPLVPFSYIEPEKILFHVEVNSIDKTKKKKKKKEKFIIIDKP